MGFADQMQRSLNYTRGLRRKKNYFKDKAFDAKWGKDVEMGLPEIQKQKLLATKNRNEAYLAERKEKSKKGLIAGVSVTFVMIYYIVKLLG